MIWLYISLGAFAAILVTVICGAIYGYRKGFYISKRGKEKKGSTLDIERLLLSNEKVQQMILDFSGREFEPVTITSYDGTRLFGKYFHIKDGAPLQIQFHGYKGNAYRDFCGGNKLALMLEHNTLLIDQRAHGQSEGHTVSMGLRERLDCLCWANYAYERFGDNIPIFLAGVSMGGATVLMASELQLPKTVCGIIADCPFSNGPDVVKGFIKRITGIPVKVAYPFAYLGALIFGGFRLDRVSAKSAVQNTKIPIAIFHGTSDTIVPYEMGAELYECCSSDDKFLFTFEGAEHGFSFMTDPDKYIKSTFDFVNLCLNKFENANK